MKAILDYKEWLAASINDTKKGEELLCATCEGEGEIEEECDCCEVESCRTCAACDGYGFIKWSSKVKTELVFTKGTYRKQLENDIRKLADWCNREYVEQLFIFGMNPYTNYYPGSDFKSKLVNFEIH